MTEAVTTTTGNLAALYAALAAAQGDFLPIEKNRDVEIRMKSGGSYRFKYADLGEVLSKTRPAMAKNGLSLFHTMEPTQNSTALVCRLAHKEGGMVTSELHIPRGFDDIKAMGAQISYLRRYMITALLGVAADDDVDQDGQEASAPQQQASTVQMPQRRQQQEQTNPVQASQARASTQKAAEQTGDPASKLQATQGEWNWINNKIQALGMTWEDAYKRAGIAFDPVEPKPVTKADFTLLKAVLSNVDV